MKCVSCLMLRHLMTSRHLNIWKVKIWLSQKRKEFSKWNQKHIFLFHKSSFLDKKQTSKNVADTTFKDNKGNTRAMCEIFSKFTIKTSEWCQWRHSSVFIVNFEQILHMMVGFPLMTLKKYMPAGFLWTACLQVAEN